MSASVVEGSPARPPGAPAIRFRWFDLLFIHWPVPADAIRPLVPDPFEIEEHDGTAWIGLVPFHMRNVRHSFAPPLPTMHHFPECNVRTYVTRGGEPGVWFLSLDATSRLAVWGARRLWNLNYVHARIERGRRDSVVEYDLRRRATPDVGFRCSWRVGARREASVPGDLAHFLTERRCMYTVDARGRAYRGRIWHDPWPLRDATIVDLDDQLLRANGVEIDPAREPVVYHSDELFAEAWSLQRC